MVEIHQMLFKCEALKWRDDTKRIGLCKELTPNEDHICDECKKMGRGKTLDEVSDWGLEMNRAHDRIRYLNGEISHVFFCGKNGCIDTFED